MSLTQLLSSPGLGLSTIHSRESTASSALRCLIARESRTLISRFLLHGAESASRVCSSRVRGTAAANCQLSRSSHSSTYRRASVSMSPPRTWQSPSTANRVHQHELTDLHSPDVMGYSSVAGSRREQTFSMNHLIAMMRNCPLCSQPWKVDCAQRRRECSQKRAREVPVVSRAAGDLW